MTDGSNMVNGDHLRAFVERIEKLEEEKRAISADVKDVYLEAKSTGFDPAIIKKVVALRRKEKAKRDEEKELLDLYLAAIGMD